MFGSGLSGEKFSKTQTKPKFSSFLYVNPYPNQTGKKPEFSVWSVLLVFEKPFSPLLVRVFQRLAYKK